MALFRAHPGVTPPSPPTSPPWGPDDPPFQLRRRCAVGEDRRAEVDPLRPTIGQNPLEVAELGHRHAEAGLESFDLVEQRAVEKAGFVRKGVLRSAVWRGGQRHDSVLHCMLRAERPGGVPM